MQNDDGAQPRLRKLVVIAADLAGFTRYVGRTDALAVADWLDRHYRAVDDAVGRHGGRVVKYIGDGVLAVFPEEECVRAVACARELLGLENLSEGLRMGANVHLAEVAEAELGPQRRYDVVGMGVNATFLLGRGPGLRISEPVYRRLENADRGGWRKQRPPTVYVAC